MLCKPFDDTRCEKRAHHSYSTWIDLNFYPNVKPKNAYLIFPADKKLISFVGRLAKDNYIDDMLKVLANLSRIRDDFVLIVVGGGEMEAYIVDWLRLHPQANTAVRLLGFQPIKSHDRLRYIFRHQSLSYGRIQFN